MFVAAPNQGNEGVSPKFFLCYPRGLRASPENFCGQGGII